MYGAVSTGVYFARLDNRVQLNRDFVGFRQHSTCNYLLYLDYRLQELQLTAVTNSSTSALRILLQLQLDSTVNANSQRASEVTAHVPWTQVKNFIPRHSDSVPMNFLLNQVMHNYCYCFLVCSFFVAVLEGSAGNIQLHNELIHQPKWAYLFNFYFTV